MSDKVKRYAQMTEEERAAWGDAEHAARLVDLAGVMTGPKVVAAQSEAQRRRLLIGASRDQATRMCIAAGRRRRLSETQ